MAWLTRVPLPAFWGGSVGSAFCRLKGTLVRIRNKDEAIAAFSDSLSGGVPEGYSVIADCAMDLSFVLEDDTCLWSVGLAPDDEAHWITGGENSFMGPDGQLWTFPSNPRYDRDIAVNALSHLYIEGVADRVDPASLAKQVKLITMKRDDAIYSLSDAARRGDLRQGREPHPPAP
jgi:hypothetical protein